MRVLFIAISTVPFGPNDLLFYRAAEELLVDGHQVMISPWNYDERNAPEYREIEAKGARLQFRSPSRSHKNFVLRQIDKARHRLRDPDSDWRFIDTFQPDAIVVSDAATYHFLSVPGLASRLDRSPVPYFTISQYNDENASLVEPVYRRARRTLSSARGLFFVSYRNLEVARRQLCDDLTNAMVVHNPPNLVDWRALPFPADEAARYCMVARLECAVKGQALLLQVLSEPQWRDRDWRLDLFGRGPDEAYLRDLIGYLRLNDKVQLRGFVKDLRALWAEQQILVMASSGEGKPLALTEAMLCGRPAVVTDVAGNAELIAHDYSGFVAHSATLTGLRGAMEQSWQARERWEEMGQRAHEMMTAELAPPPGRIVADAIVRTCAPANGVTAAFAAAL